MFYGIKICFRMSSVINSVPVVGMRRWAISIEYLINDPEGKYYDLLYYYYFPYNLSSIIYYPIRSNIYYHILHKVHYNLLLIST